MGVKGSGKTTCAKYLVEKYKFMEKSFGECLKRACQIIFLLSDRQILGTQIEKETPDSKWFDCTPRKMLQYLGTDLLRNQMYIIMPELKCDIFIRHMLLWHQNQLSKNSDISLVISDVRFQNEADFVKFLGGNVVKLIKENTNDNIDTHASEIEINNIINYDFIITNNNTVDSLLQKIDAYIYNSKI